MEDGGENLHPELVHMGTWSDDLARQKFDEFGAISTTSVHRGAATALKRSIEI